VEIKPDGFWGNWPMSSQRTKMLIEMAKTNNRKKLIGHNAALDEQVNARSGPLWDHITGFATYLNTEILPALPKAEPVPEEVEEESARDVLRWQAMGAGVIGPMI
jgi:hypothetical protein